MKSILRLFILFSLLGLILTLYIASDPLPAQNELNVADTVTESDDDIPVNQTKDIDIEDKDRKEVEAKKNQKIIAVYAGIGAWDENVTAISNFLRSSSLDYVYLYENDLSDDNLRDLYDIIWFPGGFAADYRYELRSHDNLRNFVAKGGIYIGICAGAYYAADIFNWKEEEYDYPLSLFPGIAAGPLRGVTGWGQTVDLKLNEAFAFNHDNVNSFTVYYYDGPYFNAHPDEDEKITVVASYSFNDEPAIVFSTYGEGIYLLIGPHPELGGYDRDSDQVSIDGLDGAQWPWLHGLFMWLIDFE